MGRFVVYYVYTKGKKGNPMQTNRQTRARGIVVACCRGNVVALYRGKVVTWWRGDVAKRRARGRPEGQGPPTCGRGKLRAEKARKFEES